MTEYIDREALQVILENWRNAHADANDDQGRGLLEDVIWEVDTQPAADVAPVQHGKWVKDESAYFPDDYYCVYHDWNCSNCGETVNDRQKLPQYCPECGAKMDGEEHGET